MIACIQSLILPFKVLCRKKRMSTVTNTLAYGVILIVIVKCTVCQTMPVTDIHVL